METIQRQLLPPLVELANESPAVGLLGPRQVGKSTLAHAFAAGRDAVSPDLKLAETRAQLTEPTVFFRENAGRLVVIDEIQRMPELFSVLRPLIDEDRRRCPAPKDLEPFGCYRCIETTFRSIRER